ncbi:YggN family protein [Vibrio sp. JC009]|uniref:DUF2884 family protein n=1 Tax=Vibrio sp. JC009 TaxID=2912314 RepID=UPI0023B1EF61|nr:DUF2884 family protein [Vibrio sp. JC009]WED22462.1 YggN family protein [Vibrio sp. JC009]
MKKFGLLLVLLFSGTLYAQPQCKVDIQNEVHLDGEQVEIYQQDQTKVLIDENSNLFIDGEALNLTPVQKEALEAYRAGMNEYLPRAKEIGREALELVKNVLDELAMSFNNSEAFNDLKSALEAFLGKIEKRYFNDNEMVLQEAAFGDAYKNWRQDFADARETFNAEFFSSAFDLVSESMKQEGGLNLTALKEQLTQLQTKLSGKLIDNSSEIKKEAKQYCDDLEKMAEEEKMLHEKIPELKDYQVFLI